MIPNTALSSVHCFLSAMTRKSHSAKMTPADPVAATGGEKDALTRLEKFGQAHLDKAQSVSASATRTALAWSAALVLIWFQVLEPRLFRVQTALKSGKREGTIARLRPEDVGTTAYTERLAEIRNSFDAAVKEAADQQIDLPFSVKITLAPQWFATLWLVLALGLTAYVYDARKRVFRLAIEGVRLQRQAGVLDSRIRSLVGGGVWWLAPARLKGVLEGDPLHQTLCWPRPNSNFLMVVGAAVTMLLVQARVQYVSLGIAVGLYEIVPSHTVSWLGITALNLTLGAVMAVVIWWWFGGIRVNADADLQGQAASRRAALAFGIFGAASVFNFMAMYSFAAQVMGLFRTAVAKRVNYRRRHHSISKTQGAVPLSHGLYVNPRTGTVHISTPTGKVSQYRRSCIVSDFARGLRPIEASAVRWEERGGRFASLGSGPTVDVELRRTMTTGRNQMRQTIPHPHGAHRTFMVEQQAIAYLAGNRPDLAIDLLLRASRSVSVFGLRTGMRLYDLLAGLGVRYDKPEKLKELQDILRSELTKSNDEESVSPIRLSSERIPLASTAPNTPTTTGLNEGQPVAWRRLLLWIGGVQSRDGTASFHRPHARKHPRHHHKGRNLKNESIDRSVNPVRTRLGYVKESLGKRIVKWSNTDGNWAKHWRQPGKIRWAGITLPARTSSEAPSSQSVVKSK